MSVVRKSILAVALMASGAAYAGTPGWTVSESSGPVFVAKPGLSKTSIITRGAALSAGDIISTGKGGRAVIVRGGEYLTVAPNTKVQLTEPKAGALTQIVQSFGNVVFKIQKKTTPHFQVNTPYLAAVVKGTTFSVTVTPAGASVQVTEGLVQVQSLDGLASRFVSPGEIGMISSAAPGQLSVLGTPDAPSGAATVIGAPAPAAEADPVADAPAAAAGPTVSEIAEVRIAAPIGEGNVNLAAQTGGIVSGNSSLSQAAIIEAVAAQIPATAVAAPVSVAEVAPAPVASVVAESTPAPAVVEAPVQEVAVATPPAPAAEAPPALVVEAAPAPSVVEAPALVVAEATPPAAVVETPPALVAEAAPAPAVVEAPVQVVAEVTPPAAVQPTPAQPPVLVAILETPPAVAQTPANAAPTVPAVTAENATGGNAGPWNSGNNSDDDDDRGSNNSGSGSSGSNSGSGSSNSGKSNSGKGKSYAFNKNPGSLSDLLKALQEAVKQASAAKKGD